MPKKTKAEQIPLVPFAQLKKAVQKVLSNSKRESDEHIAALTTSNANRRAAKKKS